MSETAKIAFAISSGAFSAGLSWLLFGERVTLGMVMLSLGLAAMLTTMFIAYIDRGSR